jgi:DNA replication protein DnaC
LEVLDISFKKLALNKKVSPYDSRCPFPGLYSFKKEEEEFFCGRKELITQLQEKLKEDNFLPILGASGSGKSSLVIAGLIPVLEQESEFERAYLTPKSNPIKQLKTTLEPVKNKSYLLVVDQFEELFTLCNDKKERQDFINQLFELTKTKRVILTMRADFWEECATYSNLKERMTERQILIAPMTNS